MVRITPLLYAVPVLSQFVSRESTSSGLVARQSIDPNGIPSTCQPSCEVVNTMANCAGSLNCVCTSTVGSQLQQCMSCLTIADPNVQSAADSAISSWNEACSGNLSLSGGSSSGGSTGGTTGSTSPTTTSTSSSSGSSSNPLSVTSGTVGLATGSSIATCVVAALAGAFMFF